MSRSSQVCLVVLLLACGTNARGAIVVYDFSGQAGNQVVTVASDHHASVIPIDVARGGGLSLASGANSLNSAHWHDLAANDYIRFGLTVAPGFKARLTELKFTSRSSNAGPGTLALRSSNDGFITNLKSWNQFNSGDAHVSVDLSSLGDIEGTSEFRIFSASNVSASGGTVGSSGTWRLGTTSAPGVSNLLTINGDLTTLAAVPEPSSWLLVSALATAGACTRAARPLRKRRLTAS